MAGAELSCVEPLWYTGCVVRALDPLLVSALDPLLVSALDPLLVSALEPLSDCRLT